MFDPKKVDGSNKSYRIAGTEVNGDWTQEMSDIWDEWYDQVSRHVDEVAIKLGLTSYEANMIVYLRGRSRWTQEKEDQLIKAAHEGKLWPNILSGEDEDWYQ